MQPQILSLLYYEAPSIEPFVLKVSRWVDEVKKETKISTASFATKKKSSDAIFVYKIYF